MFGDSSLSEFNQKFKSSSANPQVVVWEFHAEEYELLSRNASVTTPNSTSKNGHSSSPLNGKDKISLGEPVGTNYSLWKSKIESIFLQNRILNFQTSSSKKSTLSPAEKELVSLLKTVPVDWVTSCEVDAKKSSFTTGSWGFSKHYINWHRQPYYHLLILNCDEGEYKKKLRSITKQWVQNRKRDQDSYGVVYIHEGKMKKKMLKTSTILDKIKNDVGKENFCSMDGEKIGIPAISELTSMVVDGITQRFLFTWKRFAQQLDILEQSWELPYWNFAMYFIIRDGFALLADMFGLYAHAFKHYWDLEQIVFGTNNNYRDTQSLNDFRQAYEKYSEQRRLEFKFDPIPTRPPAHLLSKFESQFINIFPTDNLRIESTLDIPAEKIRSKINVVSLSRFEFYNYIYARISVILLKCFFTDLCAKKALHYFYDMPSKLLSQEVKSIVTANMDVRVYESYIHTWAYANVSHMLDICQHQGAFFIDGDMNTKTSYYFGDLFLLVRTHLEAIGTLNNMKLGWSEIVEDELDMLPPKINSNEINPENNLVRFESNLDIVTHLMNSLKDPRGFDQIYLELSGAASSAYARVYRNRLHLSARGSIAAIRFKQRKFEEVTEILLKLILQLRKDGWEELAGFYLVKLAQAQFFCGETKELLETILIILKNENLSQRIRSHYSKKFLQIVTHELQSPFYIPGKQFKVRFPNHKRRDHHFKNVHIGIEEITCVFTSYFRDEIHNATCELLFKPIGEVNNREDLVCQVENISIQPGLSTKNLSVPIFPKVVGEFILQRFRVFIGNVSFDLDIQESLRLRVKKSKRTVKFDYKSPTSLVVGQKQWIRVSTEFLQSNAKNLVMQFISTKPLSIFKDSIYTKSGELDSSDWKLLQLNDNCEWNSDELIKQGTTLHFFIPLVCSKESSVQCIVEKFRVDIKYEMESSEIISITEEFDLTFYDPFMYFHFEHQVSESSVMLQTVIECTNQFPIQILREIFTASDNSPVVRQLNKSQNVRNHVLLPGNNISYVFEVEFNQECKNGIIGDFSLEYYILNESGEPDFLEYLPKTEKQNFFYSIEKIQCNIPTPHLFQVTSIIEEKVIIMSEPITLVFTIEPTEMEPEDAPYETIIYEVDPQESMFMILGEKKRRLEYSTEPIQCKCTLIPITSGQLTLPKIGISLVKKWGDTPIPLLDSQVQSKYPNSRSIFVQQSEADSLGTFWKVEGNNPHSLATDGTTSHISQLSMRNPVINFSEHESESSPLRLYDESQFFKPEGTSYLGSERKSHFRTKSDYSTDESFQTISLA